MFNRKYRAQADPATWDLHPCTTPKDEDVAYAEPQALLGNVWRCHCGRRWRLVEMVVDLEAERIIYRYEEVIAGGLDAELKTFFNEMEVP